MAATPLWPILVCSRSLSSPRAQSKLSPTLVRYFLQEVRNHIDQEQVDKAIAHPMAIVHRAALLLDEETSWYSVAMFFAVIESDTETVVGHGSGTLVDLWGTKFILTAGHCVRDAEGKTVILIVARRPHRLVLDKVAPRRFVYDQGAGKDFGYFQVPDGTASQIRAQQRIFLPPHRMVAETPERLTGKGDFFLFHGYPEDIVLIDESAKKLNCNPYLMIAPPAGVGVAPPVPSAAVIPGVEVIDLWLPSSGMANLHGAPSPAPHPGRLRGASGAGCWKANAEEGRATWKPADVLLCSSYVGQFRASPNGDETFARTMSIAHVLRMIADDYTALRERMLETWPHIANVAA